MYSITANIGGRIRHETFKGKHYIVASATMIVPGVLSGSNGPMLYPANELAKNAAAWNSMPLVLGHPINSWGQPISARNTNVLNAVGLGFVFHAKADSSTDGKLIAEAWFDVEATRRIHPETLNRLQAGQPIELSTGLLADKTPVPAGSVFNGRPYTHVVSRIRPDHLAILPDQRGACSIYDGCGVNNSYQETTTMGHYLPWHQQSREGMDDDVLPVPTMNFLRECRQDCTCGADKNQTEQVANRGDVDDAMPVPSMDFLRRK